MTQSRTESALTDFQRRVLEILLDQGPQHPEFLYRKIWPDGRYNKYDPGSNGGGPSRSACAVNWHLGKMKPLVYRSSKDSAQPWEITAEGRLALRNAGLP